jgi:uncharacterized protein (TIGR00106 family)
MLCAFSITPLGAQADGAASVGDIVSDAVRLVRESGLANETNAMFTNVEGDWDDVMALLKRCVEAVGARAPRVSVVAKFDIRPGHEDMLHSKIASVEQHLSGR